MLTTINDPAFAQQIDGAIASYIKDVKEISYIEHGSDNIVAVVNREYVFRFPRNEEKARRVAYETALLQRMKGRIQAIMVPELVEVHTGPLYLVAKYIEGDHLKPDQIKAMTEDQQQMIGRTIAEFIHEFNQAVSGLEVRRLRVESGVEMLEEPWDVYFAKVFGQRLPNERLRPIIGQYYSLWQDYVRHEQNNYAIHDDLHPDNLLFTGAQLTGIVDFGDANAGSIESELRCIYITGDIVLRAAIERYQELSGNPVNYDHVRVWAITHELSRFTRRFAQQQTNDPTFLRAQQNLRSWVPEFPF